MTSIAAIVVTYNRCKMLQECLHGISKQTHPVNKIIIIDNASSDDTNTILSEMTKQNNNIDHIRLTQNTGSSGGFHEGMKRALNAGYEWLWLMDDDVEPLPDALEKQLSYASQSKCIHPIKMFPDGTEFHWEQTFHPRLGTPRAPYNKSFHEGKNECLVNLGCFEGMLIHRDIVGKIGFPDSRFFITEDDSIYGFEASFHTPIIYTKKAIFIKKIYPQKNKASDTILYYSTRNRFIVFHHLKTLGYNTLIPFLYLTCCTLKRSMKILLIEKKWSRFKLLWNGFFDGLRGKSGQKNS